MNKAVLLYCITTKKKKNNNNNKGHYLSSKFAYFSGKKNVIIQKISMIPKKGFIVLFLMFYYSYLISVL